MELLAAFKMWKRILKLPSGQLYYTILYYTILYYTILYYTILYYTILYYTILCYTILYYTILYYTILYYTILYYTILYYTILYYTILYHTKDNIAHSVDKLASAVTDLTETLKGLRQAGCHQAYPWGPSAGTPQRTWRRFPPPLSIYLSINLPIYLSTHLFVSMRTYTYRCGCLSILSICLSLSVLRSIRLSI